MISGKKADRKHSGWVKVLEKGSICLKENPRETIQVSLAVLFSRVLSENKTKQTVPQESTRYPTE